MQTSPAGRAAIEQREGRRLTAYKDSAGHWTVGVGHADTGLPPRPYAGMTITEAECDTLLAADLAPVEAAINGLGVKLSQNQFDACASLAFNIGVHGFSTSTVAHKIKAGDFPGAADAILLWDKPAELKSRREAERRQFLTPDTHPVPAAVTAPAKPVPAPAAASPSPHPAAESIPMNPITTITSVLTLAHSALSIAEGLGTAAPALAQGANSIITDGKAVIADVETIISDLKAGKYGNEGADIQKLTTDIGTAFSAIEAEVTPIASLAASSSSLPSVSGITAILSKL